MHSLRSQQFKELNTQIRKVTGKQRFALQAVPFADWKPSDPERHARSILEKQHAGRE